MAQVIKPKRGTSTPTTGDLQAGEMGIDLSAQLLYVRDVNTIKQIGVGAASPAFTGTVSIGGTANLTSLDKLYIEGQSGSTTDYARITLTDNADPAIPARIEYSGTFGSGGNGFNRTQAGQLQLSASSVLLSDTSLLVGNAPQAWLEVDNGLQFGTYTTQLLTVDNVGRVGIRTSAPEEFDLNLADELVIGNGSTSVGATIFSNSSGIGSLCFADATTNILTQKAAAIVYDHDTEVMQITSGGLVRMWLDGTTGNIGIGTDPDDSSTYKLAVGPAMKIFGATGGGCSLVMEDFSNQTTRFTQLNSTNQLGAWRGTPDGSGNLVETQFLTVDSAGFVGLGAERAPERPLHITMDEEDNSNVFLTEIHDQGDGTFGSNWRAQSSSGTYASPGAVKSNQSLLNINVAGWNGTGWTGAKAAIQFRAVEDWTATANGTYVEFRTTASGTTALTTRMTLADDGDVAINTSPLSLAKFEVKAKATAFERAAMFLADTVANGGNWGRIDVLGADVSSGNSCIFYQNSSGNAAVRNLFDDKTLSFIQDGDGLLDFQVGGGSEFQIRSGYAAFGDTLASTVAVRIMGATSDGTSNVIQCRAANGNDLFRVVCDGVVLTGTSTGSPYNASVTGRDVYVTSSNGQLGYLSSSIRFKTNIEDMPYGMEQIRQLRPVLFDWNELVDSDMREAGFIAEEFAETGMEEFVDRDENGRIDGLRYKQMVALLTKGIQELELRLEALENG